MKFTSDSSVKNNSISRLVLIWTAFFVAAIIGLFTYSETAHAGLISYLNSMLGSEEASAKTERFHGGNSQTIALLQAATNRDPNPEKSSGVSPVLDNSLIADMALAEGTGGPDAGSTQISSYIVRSGDTLSEIAEMFGVSVNTIMWANGISKGTSLHEGQNLIILPVTGIKYTIKKGDTIQGIAQAYKADIDEILQYNDLSLNSTLAAGQNIIIPDAEVEVSIPTRTVAKSKASSNYYIRPLVGGTRSQGIHGHNGVDLAAPVGTPIRASAAGKVIASATGGYNGGYGDFVIISHANGTQTLYAHASKTLVSVGQQVAQGDTIALVGNTGKSTGPHLHFEIRGAANPF